MKKILIRAAVSCMFLVLMMGLSACCGNGRQAPSTSLRYHFASQEEGQQLRLSGTEYFDVLTQNDIDWKLQTVGKSMDEFKAIAAGEILDFTDDEKKAISKVMDFIEARTTELGFRLPADDEIIFIKTNMGDEGHMGGYTLKNEIYLNTYEVEGLSRAFLADPMYDADYLEYIMHFDRALIAHEIFHCLTRNNAEFRKEMYSLIGFTVMDHEMEFGPTVSELLVHNPDVEHYDSWAEFTIGGQKRRCALLCVYPGTFADAVAVNPKAHFFDDMRIVLVPLDEPDTMIPIEEASDFYDVIGRNTDYICFAEETLADNFMNLIAFGFFGRYDHGIVTRKIEFIPYGTPRLIREMHRTLLEHFPR